MADNLDTELEQEEGELEVELLEDEELGGPENHDDEDDDKSLKDASPDLEEEEDDEARKAIRERRRQERHERKLKDREVKESLRREIQARDQIINQLSGRLDVIERRNSGSELAQIDNAKKEASQAYNYFKDQIRVATEAKDGAAVADATEKMIISRQRFDQLDNLEKAIKQRKPSQAPLDPRLKENAESWMSANTWYDPQGQDMDSRMVLTIDNALAQEGWDPTTPQYWQELDSRVKKYLPHRAKSDILSRSRPKSVVTGSGQSRVPSSGKSTFKLSAERVKAIKDAGKWDDPVARDKMIKSYREYDKAREKGE